MFRIDEKMEFKSENSTNRGKQEMSNEARYFIQQENTHSGFARLYAQTEDIQPGKNTQISIKSRSRIILFASENMYRVNNIPTFQRIDPFS
jgi:hypothetical protein